jgi:hypothetical protein
MNHEAAMAGWAGAPRQAEVNAASLGCQVHDGGGREVAEHRGRPESAQRSDPSTPAGQSRVPDAVDASVHANEAAAAQA